MAYTLDLFAVLRMLDRGDMDVYESLSNDPDTLKELERQAGWMLPLWMTGCYQDASHRRLIQRFDDRANCVWSATYGHPILQLRLLAACGVGSVRHKFYKNTAPKHGKAILDLLIQITPDIRPDEVDMWIRNNNEERVQELAQACGYQPKELKAILTEFRRVKK